MGKDNGLQLALKILLIVFFVLFFFYPLATVFAKSFSMGDKPVNFLNLLGKNSGLIWNSFYQALLSTIFAVLIGVPAAFLVARRDFPGKKIVKALSLVPFVFPSILVVISFVIIFGNNGWVNQFLQNQLGFTQHVQFLYGFTGIILAHVFLNFPLVMRFVSDAWENLDAAPKEAAKTLGAGPIQVFFRVTLPSLVPAILASASLVFIFCFMSFAVVITLGGLQFSTLEVEIYRLVTRSLDFASASVLALVQFFVLAIVSGIYFHYSKKYSLKGKISKEPVKKISISTPHGFIEAVLLALLVIAIILPMISIVFFAFFDQGAGTFSLRAFEKIFTYSNVTLLETSALSAIAFSLFLAFASSIVAVFMGLIASLKQTNVSGLNFFIGSSIAVSTITLAFGYLLGFGSGSLAIIALGHAVLSFPFAFRILNNALSSIDDDSIDAAKTLGASPLDVFWKVQFPRIKGAALASIAFSFAVSLGELSLVLVLYDGVYATIPVYIYRLISTYDIFAAAAMGVILFSVSFISFYAIELFSKDAKVF